MNRLVLMDEEDAEYRSFESLIATNDNFQSSKVMLCIFHAIWQPFKRDPLCPRKSNKGKTMELTQIGSACVADTNSEGGVFLAVMDI